mmetsp:Transcript_23348/g.51090  ORF Transcript_23348/g.51090 Transcript_23348/m.51090 type:complete len:258 (-) Transcript_23348:816-1589(-)
MHGTHSNCSNCSPSCLLGNRQEVFLETVGLGRYPELLETGLGQLRGPGLADPHGVGALPDGAGLAVRGQTVPQAHQTGLPGRQVAGHGGHDVRLHLRALGQIGVRSNALVVHVHEELLPAALVWVATATAPAASGPLLVFVVETEDRLGSSHLVLGNNDVLDLHVQTVGNFFHRDCVRRHAPVVEIGVGNVATLLLHQFPVGLEYFLPFLLFDRRKLDGTVQHVGIAQVSLDPDGGIGTESDPTGGIKQLRRSQESQ